MKLAGFAVLSGIVLHSWIQSGGLGGGIGDDSQSGTSVTLDRSVTGISAHLLLTVKPRHTVYLLLMVTAAAILLSTIYLILTRAFTRIIMHITLILSIALNVCVLSSISRTGE
jgi:hypothetical protein